MNRHHVIGAGLALVAYGALALAVNCGTQADGLALRAGLPEEPVPSAEPVKSASAWTRTAFPDGPWRTFDPVYRVVCYTTTWGAAGRHADTPLVCVYVPPEYAPGEEGFDAR